MGIEFCDVSYVYPFQDAYAVRNLSFSVQQGDFLGILGADDSGKSTLAKLTNGILLPSQGQVKVGGMVVAHDEQLQKIRQKVGVVFSDPENQIVGTTVEEDVAFGLGNLCLPSPEIRRRVDWYLERVGLRKYAKRSPRELSGGEQQKLCIAGVLAMQPDCLVLDEPLTFLDSQSRQEILDLLIELHTDGMTIMYLTSEVEELSHARSVMVLKNGTLHTQCPPTMLWNDLAILTHAGVQPSDLMVFRDALRKQGYPIQDLSWTPEAIAQDLFGSETLLDKIDEIPLDRSP
jgi:energy-coupling factor transport system ATP-binding protein